MVVSCPSRTAVAVCPNMSGSHIQDMQLSSLPLLVSLLDACTTEHELRSVCTRISPLLRARADREYLITNFHHLLGRSQGEQGEQTAVADGGGKGYGKGSNSDDPRFLQGHRSCG